MGRADKLSRTQEAEYLSSKLGRQRGPEEVSHDPASKENRFALSIRTGSHCAEHERRNYQRRSRCNPQTIQEEGNPTDDAKKKDSKDDIYDTS